MVQLKQSIEKLKSNIDHLADLFYQRKEQEGYSELNSILGEIGVLMDQLYLAVQQGASIIYSQERLMEILNEMMKAMNKKDMVLVADILLHDFTKELDGISKNI